MIDSCRFAEDSFGPRTWVDDERSNLFVQNLKTAFPQISDSKDTITEKDGNQYLDHYNSFLGDLDETCTKEEPPHQPAHVNMMKRKVGKISNNTNKLINAAQNEESDPVEEKSLSEATSKSALPQKRKHNGIPNIDLDDDSSSSGEEASKEDIVASKSSFPDMKKKNSAKKIKNISSRSKSSTIPKSNNTIQSGRWWCPKKIDLSRIRNRFFGSNKKLANTMIGDALSHRLDLKLKQNSRLLSTLPDFISNPTVRKLASCHLEKWLQSPALSGLARNLFSCIVGAIKNVNPPLPEDVIVIKNVLSMNLKANQVCT